MGLFDDGTKRATTDLSNLFKPKKKKAFTSQDAISSKNVQKSSVSNDHVKPTKNSINPKKSLKNEFKAQNVSARNHGIIESSKKTTLPPVNEDPLGNLTTDSTPVSEDLPNNTSVTQNPPVSEDPPVNENPPNDVSMPSSTPVPEDLPTTLDGALDDHLTNYNNNTNIDSVQNNTPVSEDLPNNISVTQNPPVSEDPPVNENLPDDVSTPSSAPVYGNPIDNISTNPTPVSEDPLENNSQVFGRSSDTGVVSKQSFHNFAPAYVDLGNHYTLLPKDFFTLSEKLNTIQKIVFLKLLRYSFGFQSSITSIRVSANSIQNTTDIKSDKTVRKTFKDLIKFGFIKTNEERSGQAPYYQILTPVERCTFDDGFKVDNNFFDVLIKQVGSVPSLLYLLLYFNTFGLKRNNNTVPLSHSDIISITNLSRSSVKRAFKILTENNLIKQINKDQNVGMNYVVKLTHQIFPNECNNKPVVKTRKTKFKHNTPVTEDLPNDTSVIQNPPVSEDPPVNESRLSNGKGGSVTQAQASNTGPYNFINKNKNLMNTPVNESRLSNTYHKNKILKSSSDDDFSEFKNFVSSSLKGSKNSLVITFEKFNEINSTHGLNTILRHIKKLHHHLMKAKTPTGLLLDSLKNPEKYPELESVSDFERKKEVEHNKTLEEKRRVESELKEAELSAEVAKFWEGLPKETQDDFIKKSEKFFLETSGKKWMPPKRAILESAKKRAYESEKREA